MLIVALIVVKREPTAKNVVPALLSEMCVKTAAPIARCVRDRAEQNAVMLGAEIGTAMVG
ncbi:MAG: hypothetical protein Pars2KO_07360 [Parasphingorhabdus sp.]